MVVPVSRKAAIPRKSLRERLAYARSLDAVNFLVSDVQGALGPYLNVFLVTQQHWSKSEVGLVTTVGGLIGLAVQTPIGAAIDVTRTKRGVINLRCRCWRWARS